jgi:ribosome-associated protein
VIKVNEHIVLDEREVEERFIRASGPGGQKVNKTSTAVELRFDAAGSPSLPEDVRARLLTLAGRRASGEGVIVINAQRHRSQDRNREDALARLIALIDEACFVQKARRPTKTPRAQRARRTDAKVKRGRIKAMRGRVQED